MQESDRNGLNRSSGSDDGHIEDGIPQTHRGSESESDQDQDNEACTLEDEERIIQLQARLDAGLLLLAFLPVFPFGYVHEI